MKKLGLIIISCLTLSTARTQDFHLSMYDSGPLFLNPAMTGLVDGIWRVHAQYRTQWKAVNYKPYNTALLSFDIPYKKWGFGAQIMNARAGIGNYNALQGLVSVAYSVPLTANKAHNISIGVQGGVLQKSVEYQLYTFNNQYTTSNGGSFDNSITSGESFGAQSAVLPVVNAGVMYYYAKQQSRINPFIGLSSFNLLEPKETFFGGSNKLPMRHYLHAGIRVNFNELLYFLPKILIMKQGNANEQTFAIDAGYYIRQAELYVIPGFVYRNKDAAVMAFGVRKKNYIARLSYDFNTSTLSQASTGRGGFELSFTYIKTKEEAKDKKICPRL